MNNLEITLNVGGIVAVTGTVKDDAAAQEMQDFIAEIRGAIQQLDYAARTAKLGAGDGE